MPFVLLLIGAVLVVTAILGNQSKLATALQQDVPPFGIWALSIVAVGGLGWVPGMERISRYLLALVLIVLVLRNYQNIIKGLEGSVFSAVPATASVGPAQQFAASGTVQTGSAQTVVTSSAAPTPASAILGNGVKIAGLLSNPASYLAAFGGA